MKNFRPSIFSAVMLASVMFSTVAPAQTAPAGNRYLFIAETTRTMKKALPALQQCVRELLASGMSGQLQAGDTLGLWTYNDELHAGDFPMETWTPDAAAGVTKRLDDFLAGQRCRGDARIAGALAAMFEVIADSERITVLIFSDGFEPIQGTPFDAVINRVFEQHREELREARIPFVTVLQARSGKIVHCTINSASGPINIPALPKPAPVVVPPKPVAAAPAPPPVKTNPPLILDYSKPATNAAPAAVEKVTAPNRVARAAAPVVVPKEAPKIATDKSTPLVAKPVPVAVVTTQVLPPAVIAPPVAAAEVPPAVPAAVTVAPVSAPAIKPAAEIPPARTPAPVQPEPPSTPPASAPVDLPPPAVAVATAVDVSTGWIWWALGLAGLGVVGWIVFRARTAPRVSAITESLERRKR